MLLIINQVGNMVLQYVLLLDDAPCCYLKLESSSTA